LYTTYEYYDGGQLIEKPQRFRDWSDQVFKATRAVLMRDSQLDAYVGAEARSLADKGAVRLTAG